jgi:GWxTD domain-containing protein
MRSPAPLALAACILIASGAAPAQTSALGDLGLPLSQWYEGPVRYLLTRKESKAVRKLESDEQRLTFVRAFWSRRDPTPETPENEARELLWRRVMEANRLFTATTKQGWKTDRGRTFILLGPPDERETDPLPKYGRGEIRWIYRGSPAPGTGPNQIIAFRQDRSGEYRISSNPGDYSLVWSFYTRSDLLFAPLFLTRPAPGVTRSQIMLDLGQMERPPTEQEVLEAIVTVKELPGAVPFHSRVVFFKKKRGRKLAAHKQGGAPSLIPALQEEELLPVARLQSLDDPALSYDFVYRNPFVPAPDNESVGAADHLVFQAGQGIRPGRYRTFVGIFFGGNDDVVSRQGTLEVPSFPETELSLSSLTLARRTEAAGAEESEGPYKRPFVLAGRRVIPAIANSFSNGEMFSVYYQIYNAATGTDGLSRMRITYRFFGLDGDGATALGQPVVTPSIREQAVGWSFPLEGWPKSAFRLEVTVTDEINGASTSTHVDFAIDE